jgi:hypothetical protein
MGGRVCALFARLAFCDDVVCRPPWRPAAKLPLGLVGDWLERGSEYRKTNTRALPALSLSNTRCGRCYRFSCCSSRADQFMLFSKSRFSQCECKYIMEIPGATAKKKAREE